MPCRVSASMRPMVSLCRSCHVSAIRPSSSWDASAAPAPPSAIPSPAVCRRQHACCASPPDRVHHGPSRRPQAEVLHRRAQLLCHLRQHGIEDPREIGGLVTAPTVDFVRRQVARARVRCMVANRRHRVKAAPPREPRHPGRSGRNPCGSQRTLRAATVGERGQPACGNVWRRPCAPWPWRLPAAGAPSPRRARQRLPEPAQGQDPQREPLSH